MTRSFGCSVVSIGLASIIVGTAPIIALNVGVILVSVVSGMSCSFRSLVSVCRVGWWVVTAMLVFSVVRCGFSVRFIGLKLAISILSF